VLRQTPEIAAERSINHVISVCYEVVALWGQPMASGLVLALISVAPVRKRLFPDVLFLPANPGCSSGLYGCVRVEQKL
jgi:hypothetical protein